MDPVTKGKALLERLQHVVHQTDINSKQVTQSVSYGVEQTIELLHGRKKKLEDAFKERNKLLGQSVKSSQLDGAIKEVCCCLFFVLPLYFWAMDCSDGSTVGVTSMRESVKVII